MGERFTTASRPGPRQWAALARALKPYRTQPPACPGAPQGTCWQEAAEGLEGPREKAVI